MKLTIIPSDGVIGIDGVFRAIDLTGIDPAIHAVQFDDSVGEGEIEFKRRGTTPEKITDRSRFDEFVALWVAAAPPPPGPPTPPVSDPINALRTALNADPTLLDKIKALK